MPRLTDAAKTALPQPPKTNQNVPKNSAKSFFDIIDLNIKCCCPLITLHIANSTAFSQSGGVLVPKIIVNIM